jgi:hypothetical protein
MLQRLIQAVFITFLLYLVVILNLTRQTTPKPIIPVSDISLL